MFFGDRGYEESDAEGLAADPVGPEAPAPPPRGPHGSMPRSPSRRQLLRQGAIVIGAGGALSLLGEAPAGAKPDPIQHGGPPTKLEFHPDFPTSPPEALPGPVRDNLEKAMRAAIKAAPSPPLSRGFGAVLVDVANGEIVARGKGGKGPGTSHAELNVIRTYGLRGGDLTETVLVTTAEPCPMCATCAIFSRVAGVAYGTSLRFLIDHPPTRMPIRISMPQIVAAGPLPKIPVVGGVLHKETDPLFR